MSQSRFRVPHTLVLLFAMILVAWAATWLIPQGAFETEGRAIIPGTYERVADAETARISGWQLMKSIPKGFDKSKDIIFFVFIVGGAFAVLRATGAADALIGLLLRKFGRSPGVLILGGMFVFAAGSSTIGMAEEYLPFVPLVIALCAGLGYDRMTAVGLLCVGYGVGYGVAAANPFTLLVAQDIAGLKSFSGWPFRLGIALPFLLLGFHHVWSYAKRSSLDPTASLVADLPFDGEDEARETPPLTPARILCLVSVLALIALQIWGIRKHDWYLVEMGALFLMLCVILGVLGRLGFDGTARHFCEGAQEVTTTALLIGFAGTIGVVLEDGQVLHSVVHGIAGPLESAGTYAATVGMFAVQCLLNLFIPSGSGQAYVTMPIMAPLADVVGVSKQTAVLAYQFGDGFMNIVVPTNAVLIGILGVAGVPYDRWFRFVFPFILKVFVLGSITLAIAVAMGWE